MYALPERFFEVEELGEAHGTLPKIVSGARSRLRVKRLSGSSGWSGLSG
jgi:hypothetical protein